MPITEHAYSKCVKDITLLIVIDTSGSSGYNTFAALQYADARRIADAHALMYTM